MGEYIHNCDCLPKSCRWPIFPRLSYSTLAATYTNPAHIEATAQRSCYLKDIVDCRQTKALDLGARRKVLGLAAALYQPGLTENKMVLLEVFVVRSWYFVERILQILPRWKMACILTGPFPR